MTMTAIGLFDGFSEAQRVIHTLVAQDIRREDITLIANREETSVSDVLSAAAWGVNVDVGSASRGEPAAFIALGVPVGEAPLYAEGVRRGGRSHECHGGRSSGGPRVRADEGVYHRGFRGAGGAVREH